MVETTNKTLAILKNHRAGISPARLNYTMPWVPWDCVASQLSLRVSGIQTFLHSFILRKSIVQYAFNLSTREAEGGVSLWVQGQPHQHSSKTASATQWDHFLKEGGEAEVKKEGRKEDRETDQSIQRSSSHNRCLTVDFYTNVYLWI